MAVTPAAPAVRKIRCFGWIPDIPDFRDHLYAAPPERLAALPPKVDLRPLCPPVYDQGELGSCTANAIGAAHQFQQVKQKAAHVIRPSRLFIYYNERVMEGTVNIDSGAMIRDGIKSVAVQGVCSETTVPYIIANFKKKPSKAAYKEALVHQSLNYRRILHSLSQMKGCLAGGYPFTFGFAVYESFIGDEVARTGIAQMPKDNESMLGGHAVLAVGYDDSTRRFLVRNSWGARWGMAGYYTMPYEYLTNSNLADDFWTIRLVEV